MAKVKGKKKLNKAIKKALAPLGVENVKLDTEWSYDFETDTLHYSLTEYITDIWFNEYIRDTFRYIVGNTVEDIFLISVLHEVGHRETIDFIPDKVYNKCLIEKGKIQTALENAETETEMKKIEYKYFALTDENQATEWAVNYARKHRKKVKKMQKAVVEAVAKFYVKNGVTAD